MNIEKLLIKSIKASLYGEKMHIPAQQAAEFTSLASAHKLLPLLYNAVKDGLPPEYCRIFADEYVKAVSRLIIQQNELKIISDSFSENKIKNVQIKGRQLSRLYPLMQMRVSADIDFLVLPQDVASVRNILENMGYETVTFDCNTADTYHKPPIMNVEIHDRLFEDDFLKGYFDDIINRTVYDEKLCCNRLNDVDNYIYVLAHFYKHYIYAGCGARFIIDHYLLTKSLSDSDKKIIYAKLKQLNLFDFCKKIDSIAAQWFDNSENDANLDESMYILGSGIYGTKQNIAQNRKDKLYEKYNSKILATFVYYLRRLFPNIEQMKTGFSAVNRHPSLVVFFWIYRLIRAPFIRIFKH